MKRRIFVLVSLLLAGSCFPQTDQIISLPPPRQNGGKPVLQVLKERESSRSFSAKKLSKQTLSSLLWAADGISRPDGRRTAPTGLNVQDTDIYVMLSEGVYLYDHKAHSLRCIKKGDFRNLAGSQTYPKKAPLNLFYVHDRQRAMAGDARATYECAGVHTGAIMQNVYLFCASEGLSCVARRSYDEAALKKLLRLSEKHSIVLAQTVGYPNL